MRGTFSVDEPQGDRWDLAVELLRRGEQMVSIGPLLLYRDAAGPQADGMLHCEICTAWRRQNLTIGVAEAEIESGLCQLDLVLADERVAALADRYGLACDYVEDYEISRSPLATVARDGGVTWDRFMPNP